MEEAGEKPASAISMPHVIRLCQRIPGSGGFLAFGIVPSADVRSQRQQQEGKEVDAIPVPGR